jgi:rhodanese-related sulfurtransferase
MKKIKEVTPSEAFSMTKNGALLVDVREPREVAGKAFDAPGTLQVPMSQFGQRFQEIPSDRKVIVACNTGSRSMMAARLLSNQGYRNIVNLQHGIVRWEQEGLPVRMMEKQNSLSWLQKLLGKAARTAS